MDLEREYYYKFNDFPPVLVMCNTNSEIYQQALKDAIKSGKQLTADKIEEYFDKAGEPIDIKY